MIRPARKPTQKVGVRYDSRHVKLKTGEGELKNGTYYFRWTDDLGKRHSVYAPTLDMLRSKEEEITVDRHDGIYTEKGNMTVNELFDLWISMKRGIKGSTRSLYMATYNNYVRHVFGQKRLNLIKRSDVKRFYNSLYEEHGLRIASIDKVHTVLNQVFQVAVDDNIIRKNPCDNVLKELKMANGTDVEKRNAMTLNQQKMFLQYMLKDQRYRHWYPIFFIMLNTGMRVGETVGLTWSDIDLEKRTISINHNLVYYNHLDEGCGFRSSVNSPKTKAGTRVIPMTQKVAEAFEMEKQYQQEAEISCKANIDGYSDFVFLNQEGQPHKAASLNKALHRIVRDCNYRILDNHHGDDVPNLLPPLHCHLMRHTFATRMVESGIGPNSLKELLGHADIKTTFNIYAHLTEEAKARDMSAYEIYIDDVMA